MEPLYQPTNLWPAEPSSDEAVCRPHSGVVDGVERLENRLPILDGHYRTSGQDRCAEAIAEKSTDCASAMAAKIGHSEV
jgi:hypothetical protein